MKKKPFLEIYTECCKLGRLPSGSGLCLEAFNSGDESWSILRGYFEPIYAREAPNMRFWGSGSGYPRIGVLTPLRENILLLCACINNEM